ncbi:GNAT family N-acetyltransferase [Actinoallomurus oryzae]|uniref:GNAT family N-acetyltransferase n=1 Tax=Actinoallomurus oryzae TaxID=502180 RepID=A0ABP8Q002_9ACTN
MPELVEPAVPAGRMGGRPQPCLSVDELTIRPWAPPDVPVLVAAYANEDIRRWHARSLTEDEAVEWVSQRTDRWRREAGADWAVAEGDTVLGRVGLRRLSLAEGLGEAAYWVLPAARGRAVAARALTAVTDWMFALGLNRMELAHSTLNRASCRAAEKAGYAYEGTMRGHSRHTDGYHDMHLHARLGADKPGAKGAAVRRA